MKKCSCCQKIKDESEFYRNRRTADKLQHTCKECTRLMNYGYSAQAIRQSLIRSIPSRKDKDDFCFGGISIAILNRPKRFETTFTIVNTNSGEKFATNEKKVFFQQLEKMLAA